MINARYVIRRRHEADPRAAKPIPAGREMQDKMAIIVHVKGESREKDGEDFPKLPEQLGKRKRRL